LEKSSVSVLVMRNQYWSIFEWLKKKNNNKKNNIHSCPISQA